MPDATTRSAPVGRPVEIEDLVLPGTRLQPRADPDRTAPVTVRVVDVAPHGDLLRYRLEATGWEPGEHDLRDALQRADGGSTADLPTLAIVTESHLPAGTPRVEVPAAAPPIRVGGYGTAMLLLGACWIAGFVAILLAGRRRAARTPPDARSGTPGDRLAHLAAASKARPLENHEKAEVERLVWEAWRRELAVGQAPPETFLAKLRADARASEALDALEAWLHAPKAGAGDPHDTADLIARILPPVSGPDGNVP